MKTKEILLKSRVSYLKKLKGVIQWSLVRHKYLVPAFSIAQAAFAIAIISPCVIIEYSSHQVLIKRLNKTSDHHIPSVRQNKQ